MLQREDRIAALEKLCRVQVQLKKFDEATKNAHRARVTDPLSGTYEACMAEIALGRNKPEEALKVLEPQLKAAQRRILGARIHLQLKNYVEAAALAQAEYDQSIPHSPEAGIIAGEAHLKLNRYKEARQALNGTLLSGGSATIAGKKAAVYLGKPVL
jgi:tetratricopeptide (TPR) repeat protein